MLPWLVVALDESTAIKNPGTKITAICVGETITRIDKATGKRVRDEYPGFVNTLFKTILSGLPYTETELDIFMQMKFLYGRFMGCKTYYAFRQAYFEIGALGKWEPRRGLKMRIKQEVHRLAFVLRRSEVHAGSERKIKETRYTRMVPVQEAMYRQAEDEFAVEIRRAEGRLFEVWETQHTVVQRTWLARIAGGCDPAGQALWPNKVDELTSLLQGELASQPVVVWFRFNQEIEMVEAALRKKGIPYATLIGDTTRDERQKRLKWFRESRVAGRVLLCQIKLAKFGVDCSVSDTAIYYSMTYSCEEIAQSQDRILHPKKKVPLLYLHLAAKDTVDEDVIYATARKVTNAQSFVTKFVESFERRREVRAA